MNLNISSFESLRKFLVCYFHEDFLLEYATPEEALNDFASAASVPKIQKVLSDLERLMSMQPENDEVRDWLLSAHCAYDPRAYGTTELDWLQHIRSKLLEALE